jgi:hypothetical protein
MDPVPIAPSCGLDQAGLRRQYARYRTAGAGARLVERTPLRLVVDLDQRVDPQLVDELLAIERECCPFFELGWEPSARRFSASVSEKRYEPALDAIAFALNLPVAGRFAPIRHSAGAGAAAVPLHRPARKARTRSRYF